MRSEELRRKAAQCARLANGAVSHEVANALRLMAEEYEAEAARCEAAPLGVRAETAAAPN